MKRNLIVIAVILIFAASCTKSEDSGSLEVTVTDVADNPITGKYVYVFDSEEDMNKHLDNGTGIDKYKKITDNDGVAYINNVKIGDYWLCCSFDNISGGTTDITGTAAVTSEKITEVLLKP